jgi:hypothetical protein
MLGELQSTISAALSKLDQPGSYSHNIISLCLQSIAKHYGKDAANEAIRDHDLDKKGWSEK